MNSRENKKKIITTKRKMQQVDFKTIEDFLSFLPEDELRMVELLRKTIFNCVPDAEEKLTYNVPFYKRHSNFCFIWPSAVQWGNVKHLGVQFGFTKGYLMQDEINWLEKGNRKQVYWRTFFPATDIDIELLKAYIFEAVFIDEQASRTKKKKI
jgi:hypothetical protein